MAVRHITSACGLLFQRLYLGPFSRHYHLWTERDCLRPWDLLHFWQRILNYKPRALSNLCVNISWLNCALFMSYKYYKGFRQQKWPSNSLKSSAIMPFDSTYRTGGVSRRRASRSVTCDNAQLPMLSEPCSCCPVADWAVVINWL